MTNYVNATITPPHEGVYPVKTKQVYEEKFSFFDGRYWRGAWNSAAEAWQMKCAPVTFEIYQWFNIA
jgi:hypothetical protein